MRNIVLQDRVQLGINVSAGVQLAQQGVVGVEDSIDEILFNSLKELKVERNEFRRQHALHSIGIILTNSNIDPFYIDDIYAEQLGVASASIFDILAEIEALNDDEEEIFAVWQDQLVRLLVTESIRCVRDNQEFDRVFVIDKILTFGSRTRENQDCIMIVSDQTYDFEALKSATEHYCYALETLLLPEVILAIRNLRLDIESIMNLRAKFNANNTENFVANDFIKNILNNANQQHVIANNSQELLKSILNSSWPEDFSLHNNIQNLEYFKLITSSKLQFFVNQGYESLEFFLSLPLANLRQMINEPDLEVVLGLIGDMHDMRANIHLASASMPTSTIGAGPVVVQPQVITSGLAFNNPNNNYLERGFYDN